MSGPYDPDYVPVRERFGPSGATFIRHPYAEPPPRRSKWLLIALLLAVVSVVLGTAILVTSSERTNEREVENEGSVPR